MSLHARAHLNPWETARGSLETVLRAAGESFRCPQPNVWIIPPHGRYPKASVQVSFSEDWITFEASTGDGECWRKKDLWTLLQQRLSGLVRLTISSDQLKYRVDVPIDSPDMEHILTSALKDIKIAAHGCSLVRAGQSAAVEPPLVAPVDVLAAACSEAGWPVHVREDRARLSVNLDAPGMIRQAQGLVNSRCFSLFTDLAVFPGLPDKSLQCAQAVFLLKTAGAIRLARPFVRPSSGQCILGFEVDWPGRPDACSVHHVLAALSVAVEMASRALKALENPLVTTLYLKDNDISPDRAGVQFSSRLAIPMVELVSDASLLLETGRQSISQ